MTSYRYTESFFEDDPDTLLTSETNFNKVLPPRPFPASRDKTVQKRHKKRRACALFCMHACMVRMCFCVCVRFWAEHALGPHDVTALLTYMPPTSQPPLREENSRQARDTDSTLHSTHAHALMHKYTHMRADVGAN